MTAASEEQNRSEQQDERDDEDDRPHEPCVDLAPAELHVGIATAAAVTAVKDREQPVEREENAHKQQAHPRNEPTGTSHRLRVRTIVQPHAASNTAPETTKIQPNIPRTPSVS
jgi:hypothetical protein